MKSLVLWHPDSPGMRVPVVRTWWQRLIYPTDFATIGESLKYYKYEEAFKMMRTGEMP